MQNWSETCGGKLGHYLVEGSPLINKTNPNMKQYINNQAKVIDVIISMKQWILIVLMVYYIFIS